ncbi:MAG TPA: DNA polymerase III subunit delta [Spirochaetia bacterium]|nr:DNA polymerase III subunit delta [Spirochaetia bacterium]
MNSASVHLLLGPETGEKERFLEGLRAQIAKTSGASPEVTNFYTFDTSVGDVLAILRNGSLFSTHRLVVLKGVDTITKKAETELLCEYLANPAPDATLCLIAETPSIDKRIEKAVPASNKKIFWELFENQKRSWITQYFRSQGMTVSSDASELLLEMVENNTRDMERECEKLSLFCGKGSTLEVGDVESYIYHSKEENVFTLFDHVVAADFAGSLETVQSIVLSGETNGVALLSGLLWQFRRLHQIKLLIEENYGEVEACMKAQVRSKRGQKTYITGTKNYTAQNLEDIISLIARYDALVRGMRTEVQSLLLELFLYYCIVKRGTQPEPYRS